MTAGSANSLMMATTASWFHQLIMKTFNLGPCSEIGVIKSRIKEAILEGEISNDPHQAFDYMIQMGSEMGLSIEK